MRVKEFDGGVKMFKDGDAWTVTIPHPLTWDGQPRTRTFSTFPSALGHARLVSTGLRLVRHTLTQKEG